MERDDETRLLQTFDLFEFGFEMMAANLRRRHPDASAVCIEALLESGSLLAPKPMLATALELRSH